NTLSLTLPPQGGGDYKVTLWQDHRESTFIKDFAVVILKRIAQYRCDSVIKTQISISSLNCYAF
ncbi:MAG: hypothetical protein Q8P40_09025, partial [Nitrospirota bacterium]|nr:hypothetical protein [Nitrospirota bacterium]